MQHHKYNYLFEIQFLGIRYSGWQFIEGQSTVEGMLRKTLKFIWGHENFKTFGTGRTDAKVSAEQFFVHVFSDEQISSDFVELMNFNLPADIAMLSYSSKPKGYNALANVKTKEYHYKVGKSRIKNVFEASTKEYFRWDLNWIKFQEAASCFEGVKNYRAFTVKNSKATTFDRNVNLTVEDKKDFFVLKFQSQGFMRYQIRLMVGAMVLVSRGELSIGDLTKMLETGEGLVKYIAPGSGLTLHKVIFD